MRCVFDIDYVTLVKLKLWPLRKAILKLFAAGFSLYSTRYSWVYGSTAGTSL